MTKLYYIIFLIILTSCGVPKKTVFERHCSKLYKNDFAAYNIDKFSIVTANDSGAFNQLKFYCIEEGSPTELMSEKFGKWQDEYWLSEFNSKMHVWKNVDLFEDKKLYSVYTYAFDDQEGPLFDAIVVSDAKDVDMLSENSIIRDNIITFFSEGIRSLGNPSK